MSRSYSPLLSPNRQMCYKRCSEGAGFHYGAGAESPDVGWRGDAAGSCSTHRTGVGICVAILPRLFGAAQGSQLQVDLSGLWVLYVVLGFLLRQGLAGPSA